MSMSSKVREKGFARFCPFCGSDDIRTKVFVKGNNFDTVYGCVSCGEKFNVRSKGQIEMNGWNPEFDEWNPTES